MKNINRARKISIAEAFFAKFGQSATAADKFLALYNTLIPLMGSANARTKLKAALGVTYRELGLLLDYCREDGETAGKRPTDEQIELAAAATKACLEEAKQA